jgi:hypothetical protein
MKSGIAAEETRHPPQEGGEGFRAVNLLGYLTV